MAENLSITHASETFIFPKDSLFTAQGAWITSSGCRLRVGISDFLRWRLGEIISVNLTQPPFNVRQGEAAAVLETSAEAFNVLSPLTGKARTINTDLLQNPNLINQNPYGDGWLYEADPFNWEDDKALFLSPIEYYHQVKEEIEEMQVR